MYRGLTVVAIPPNEIIERKVTGNRMELGANMRTTSPFLMPRLERPAAKEATVDLSWWKVRVWLDSASMRAGRSG